MLDERVVKSLGTEGLAALIGNVRHTSILKDTFCLVNRGEHPQEIYISWIEQIYSISTFLFPSPEKNCYVSCNNFLMTLGYDKAFTNKTYIDTYIQRLSIYCGKWKF